MSTVESKQGLSSLEQYQEYVPVQSDVREGLEDWTDLQLRERICPRNQAPISAPALPHHTLTFVYAGTIRGARRTGGRPWKAFDTRSDGHVTVRPAGWSTALRWQAAQPIWMLSLYLLPERLEEAGLEMGIAPSRIELDDTFNVNDPVLRQLSEEFRNVAAGIRPHDPLYHETALRVLVVRLLRRYSTASLSESGQAGRLSRARFHRIGRYVRAELDGDLSLDDLAQEVGLSKYHFSRRFKQRAGQSPYQFVIYERVRRARRLLRETDQPLARVALEVGFSSQSHFTRTFKRHVGATPGTYRGAWP